MVIIFITPQPKKRERERERESITRKSNIPSKYKRGLWPIKAALWRKKLLWLELFSFGNFVKQVVNLLLFYEYNHQMCHQKKKKRTIIMERKLMERKNKKRNTIWLTANDSLSHTNHSRRCSLSEKESRGNRKPQRSHLRWVKACDFAPSKRRWIGIDISNYDMSYIS